MAVFLQRENLLTTLLLVATVAGLVWEAVGNLRRRRREGAADAAARAGYAELRRRLWSQGAVCPGAEAELAVMVARAERLARAARAAEKAAREAVAVATGGREREQPYGIDDRAIDADARLQELLVDLRRSLPDGEVAALDDAQRDWVGYRDHHVRLCRDLRAGSDDRWPVRHFVSEAVTLARVADLEDLRELARLDRDRRPFEAARRAPDD